MSFGEFNVEQRMIEFDFLKKIDRVTRDMAKPETSPFTDYLIHQNYDKVVVNDIVDMNGRQEVLVSGHSKYIPALDNRDETLLISTRNPRKPHDDRWQEFCKKNPLWYTKFVRATKEMDLRQRREYIEYQIGGVTPHELRLTPIPEDLRKLLDYYKRETSKETMTELQYLRNKPRESKVVANNKQADRTDASLLDRPKSTPPKREENHRRTLLMDTQAIGTQTSEPNREGIHPSTGANPDKKPGPVKPQNSESESRSDPPSSQRRATLLTPGGFLTIQTLDKMLAEVYKQPLTSNNPQGPAQEVERPAATPAPPENTTNPTENPSPAVPANPFAGAKPMHLLGDRSALEMMFVKDPRIHRTGPNEAEEMGSLLNAQNTLINFTKFLRESDANEAREILGQSEPMYYNQTLPDGTVVRKKKRVENYTAGLSHGDLGTTKKRSLLNQDPQGNNTQPSNILIADANSEQNQATSSPASEPISIKEH